MISIGGAALQSRQRVPSAPPMPLGNPVRLMGLLLTDGFRLVLRTDDGGVWRVEAGKSARTLVGRRVLVIGTRDAFDLVAADSVTLVAS